ncbi:hypothetical protein ACVWZ6_002986 [Bradyrhizobium sp. GM6.1]
MVDDMLDRALQARAVRGTEAREKEFIARRLILFDAEQHSRGFRPLQLARPEIEIPGADAKAFDPDAEMLAASVLWRMRYAAQRQATAPILPRRGPVAAISPKAGPEASSDV